MKTIANNLRATGERVSGFDFVFYVVGGLGPEVFFFFFEKLRAWGWYGIWESYVKNWFCFIAKVYLWLISYESKIAYYNTLIVVNIGLNTSITQSSANTIHASSLTNYVTHVGFGDKNVNFSPSFNVNISTRDFGDLNSNNIGFVNKLISGFDNVHLNGLVGNFSNMNISTSPHSF